MADYIFIRPKGIAFLTNTFFLIAFILERMGLFLMYDEYKTNSTSTTFSFEHPIWEKTTTYRNIFYIIEELNTDIINIFEKSDDRDDL